MGQPAGTGPISKNSGSKQRRWGRGGDTQRAEAREQSMLKDRQGFSVARCPGRGYQREQRRAFTDILRI